MKKLIVLSFTSVLLLGLVACHSGGSNNSNLGTNPGGMFGDDDPATEVTICHVPEGLVEGAYTMIIASTDLEEHLAHGDTEGECLTDGPPLDDGRTDGGTDGGADGDDDDDDSTIGRIDHRTGDPADGDDDDDDDDDDF